MHWGEFEDLVNLPDLADLRFTLPELDDYDFLNHCREHVVSKDQEEQEFYGYLKNIYKRASDKASKQNQNADEQVITLKLVYNAIIILNILRNAQKCFATY